MILLAHCHLYLVVSFITNVEDLFLKFVEKFFRVSYFQGTLYDGLTYGATLSFPLLIFLFRPESTKSFLSLRNKTPGKTTKTVETNKRPKKPHQKTHTHTHQNLRIFLIPSCSSFSLSHPKTVFDGVRLARHA